jgi:VanZ family protein
MALIFFLSAQSDLPAVERVSDKTLHVAAYFVFGLLCLRATHGGFVPLRVGPVLAAVALAVAYGGLDEWHQSWVPGRTPSVLDWVADGVGVALACAAVALWTRFRRSRRGELADR